MACDTFIKITKKCHKHFVVLQGGETQPFIVEILNNMGAVICDLQPGQIHTFYEALGYVIPAQSNTEERAQLISMLMQLPNQMWDAIIQSIKSNGDNLSVPENVKHLATILKTNISACKSIGAPFVSQIGRIFLDMLILYKSVSLIISRSIVEKGKCECLVYLTCVSLFH
jgi:exportin-1